MILVTGGCGFIGSNFVSNWLNHEDESILVVDKLTYAGNRNNLAKFKNNNALTFVQADITDPRLMNQLLNEYKPRAVLNFAAETHVDRSIKNPQDFISSNINGTFTLLEQSRHYWQELSLSAKQNFRFLQISTDEVYGSLSADASAFTELDPYLPNNPYSASKAAADHLVKAYFHTYGFPALITNCSNNFGPFQFPEKLIPFTILNALQNKPILIYGDGLQIRDWLFVEDHCEAVKLVLTKSQVGETYNIGAACEQTNLAVVNAICHILDELVPRKASYSRLITHITDRPGHDTRYAIDASKIRTQLHWQPQTTFIAGLKKTVSWYLENLTWIDEIQDNPVFAQWLAEHYT